MSVQSIKFFVAGMKTILTVDDAADILTSCHLALINAGYLAYEADSVETAFQLAQRLLPDLILCDVNMPDGGGRELLKRIRNTPALASKQFVFMSGDSFEISPRRAMELGADDVLTKPFSLAELWRCVEAGLTRGNSTGDLTG